MSTFVIDINTYDDIYNYLLNEFEISKYEGYTALTFRLNSDIYLSDFNLVKSDKSIFKVVHLSGLNDTNVTLNLNGYSVYYTLDNNPSNNIFYFLEGFTKVCNGKLNLNFDIYNDTSLELRLGFFIGLNLNITLSGNVNLVRFLNSGYNSTRIVLCNTKINFKGKCSSISNLSNISVFGLTLYYDDVTLTSGSIFTSSFSSCKRLKITGVLSNLINLFDTTSGTVFNFYVDVSVKNSSLFNLNKITTRDGIFFIKFLDTNVTLSELKSRLNSLNSNLFVNVFINIINLDDSGYLRESLRYRNACYFSSNYATSLFDTSSFKTAVGLNVSGLEGNGGGYFE